MLHTKPSRPGIATLELVLVFPLLLSIAAALFILGRATLRKEATATQARNSAWQKRPQAAAGTILHLDHDPLASQVDFTGQKPVQLAPLFKGTTLQAESRSFVLGHTWDFRALPFAPGQGDFRPHADELAKLASAIPGLATGLSGTLAVFAFTINPDRNPLMIVVAVTGRVLNPVVEVAGWILKYPVSWIVTAARIVVKALEWAARLSFQFGLAHFFGRVANLMSLGLEAFDNLYEASRGRPGTWDPGMAGRLLRTIP
jgi:hypothetical protein